MGGDELVFDVYNAAFAIGIALGSGLASYLLAGRTLDAADADRRRRSLVWSPSISPVDPHRDRRRRGRCSAFPPSSRPGTPGTSASTSCFCRWRAASISCPAFAAVQAWAPADQRARVVAAVNVHEYVVHGARPADRSCVLQNLGASFAMVFAILGVGISRRRRSGSCACCRPIRSAISARWCFASSTGSR